MMCANYCPQNENVFYPYMDIAVIYVDADVINAV